MADSASSAPGSFVRPGAEPFLLTGGPVGVLLLHGYFGTPHELRFLGEALANAGYTVHAPLLAGHGGAPAAMLHVRWQDWQRSAASAVQRLQAQCRTVFVAGISMGALLAFDLAAHDAAIPGIIAMAPALQLRGERQMALTGMLKYAMPWFYPLRKARFDDPRVQKQVRQWVPDADLNDPAVIADVRREARIPVASVYELVKLQRHVRRELPRVAQPVLLLQGRKDEVVDTGWVNTWRPKLGARDVELRWFERSGHVLPSDAERAEVAQTAVAWLRAHE